MICGHPAAEAAIVDVAPGQPGAARRGAAFWLGWGLAGGAFVLAGFLAGKQALRDPRAQAGVGVADAGFHRFTHLTFQSGLESSPTLSPDGE